jgi:hypothetical protein
MPVIHESHSFVLEGESGYRQKQARYLTHCQLRGALIHAVTSSLLIVGPSVLIGRCVGGSQAASDDHAPSSDGGHSNVNPNVFSIFGDPKSGGLRGRVCGRSGTTEWPCSSSCGVTSVPDIATTLGNTLVPNSAPSLSVSELAMFADGDEGTSSTFTSSPRSSPSRPAICHLPAT